MAFHCSVNKVVIHRVNHFEDKTKSHDIFKNNPYFFFSNRENDQEEEDVPSINSAVVSLNLRPLTANTFEDPVKITLRHTVVGLSRDLFIKQ